ncbi:auxin-responsive protein SAUR68-like [Trifolium pratense]|uniref:auxin-responsive protein SAUR68-like n=1 Tax=Trifolium pratense TaxID=57577 RepID=UPI001E69056B|nr:auxin-responsive protein SAUR68-like [Trifolium pratense]
MISAKRLIEMAKKWQKMAARKRKRISYPRNEADMKSSSVNKGHFVVYSIDSKRFVIPLKYLSTNVFRELFKWSEEVFGLPGNGPIMLPCDSVFLDYAISLVQEQIPEDVEKALITFMYAACQNEASSSFHDLRLNNEPIIIYGF